MDKIATLTKTHLAGFTGVAHLFRLSPPLVEFDRENKPVASWEHVIVSATQAPYSGRETLIFPATEAGEVRHFGSLEGSTWGTLDHSEALRNAGYTVNTDNN